MSLEIISGEAIESFETPKSNFFKAIENKNKYSYIFKAFKKSKNLLNIKASKNTSYRLINSPQGDYKEKYAFAIGNNYLFELKDNFRCYNLSFMSFKLSYKNDDSYDYLRFFPINCQIEIKNLNHMKKLEDYQELISQKEENYNYNVKRVDNKNESYQFYVSTYSLNLNRNFKEMEAVIISNNISHYSIFNKEINKIKYFYPHSEVKKDLMVNFTIKNKTKEIYIFSVRNKDQIYNITSQRENSLTFKSSYITNFCKDGKEICNIYFALETNNKNESTVEFIVTTFDPNIPESESFFKKNLKMILIIAGGVIILSIIIILLIVCLCKKKNNDLSLKVNQISFEEERGNKNNEDDESLLP